ncbi:uncharacterized protein LOC111626609 [Centruroides sculpturatus]|uniref:uncharacterized protein LOC111626609 n=1 Tax=Centruroides sculpturatus TaxID=218467 RepID=UPI000C6D8CF9|nr:uncharacterized protein LOC111626609 [Centruroides sculpturatus]
MAPKTKSDNSRLRRCDRLPKNKNEHEKNLSEKSDTSKTVTTKVENSNLDKKENNNNNNNMLCNNYPVRWDVSTDVIADILQDMGVGILEDIPYDIAEYEPTPPSNACVAITPNTITSKVTKMVALLTVRALTDSSQRGAASKHLCLASLVIDS